MSTTVTKRPVATISNGGWILHPGTPPTMWECIADEPADNSTFIASGGIDATGRVTIDDFAIPASAILTDVRIRLRLHANIAGQNCYVAINDRVHAYLAAEDTGTWPTVTSGALSATAAELNAGCAVRLTGSYPNVEVSELWLDATYVAVPTVNVTDPTGTIGVTRPTVQWNTSSDFPQSRFQVKVFSSDQYGGAGFDPDDSTPLYDSGERLGATEEHTPDFNFPDGDSYRFYVRVAQTVGSVTQWSDWDFSTATVNVTPPDRPTLTVTAQDGQGRIKIKVNGAGTPAWDHVLLQRTSDGGGNWVAVRSADHAQTSGANFVVYDYESGNGQLVQYRAQAIIVDPAGDIASDWSNTSTAKTWDSPDTWLKSLTNPLLNARVRIFELPTLKRRKPRSVLDVAGRADPIVVSDTRKTVEGTVTFACADDVALANLQTLLDLAEVLLLQTPAAEWFGSRYIDCGDEDENRITRRAQEAARYVVVPFVEVSAPVGEVVTFGATWDDVVSDFATWNAVKAAFPTWNSLLTAHLGTA